MKSTGIVRKIDGFGRIVVPVEMRRALQLADNVDSLEIYCEGNLIVLRKYAPGANEVREASVARRVDELGRVLIPKEVRKGLGITDVYNDLEFFTREDGCILLGLYIHSCCFCGGADGLRSFREKLVCAHCLRELGEMSGERG